MRKKQLLCAVLTAAILVGNGATAKAANVQPQSSKDAATYQEVEPNNDSANATVIPVNQQCMGVLDCTTGHDVDWYKVSKTENGYIQIKLDVDVAKYHEKIAYGWDIDVYDSQFNRIAEYDGIKSNFVGGVLPYRKGEYYIKVAEHIFWGPENVPYKITVSQVKSDVWEQESNDTQSMANAIKTNKEYTGYLEARDATDWFQIDVKKNSVAKFSLGRGKNLTVEQVQAIGNGWKMTIYASNGSQLGELTEVTDKKNCTLELKKGKYYIKLSAQTSYWNAPTDIPYNFKVSNADIPDKTKIQKVTGSKKAVTVKWKRVAGASGYYVYRSNSKNGAYRRVATLKGVTKTTFKNRKLKSGKTYYYKIAAYKKANGVTAVAKQCTAKSAKAK